MKELKLIGVDYFSRYVFKDVQTGIYYCDVYHLEDGKSEAEVKDYYNTHKPELDDKCGDFESEPSGFNSITNYTII